MDQVNEWMKICYCLSKNRNLRFRLHPKIACKDGFIMSVQASQYHYCLPRADHAYPYFSVEIGYPSAVDDLILEYAEDQKHPTDTVYPYVPIDVVNQVVDKHGGIVISTEWMRGEEDDTEHA